MFVGHLGQGGASCVTPPHPPPPLKQTSVLYQCRVLELSGLLPLTSTRQGTDRFPTLSPMSNGFVSIFFQRSWGFFFLPTYLVSCPSSGLRLFPCKRVQDKNGVLCLFSMAADYLGFMPIATNIKSSAFPQSFWKQPVEGHGKEYVSPSRLSNRKYTKLITEERLYFSMVLE